MEENALTVHRPVLTVVFLEPCKATLLSVHSCVHKYTRPELLRAVQRSAFIRIKKHPVS